MKTTKNGGFGASWAYGLLTLLLASCGADTAPIAQDPSDPRPPLAVQEKRLTDSTKARAADYGGGHAGVTIRDEAGKLLFGMEYTPQDDGHILVTNKIDLGALQHNDAGVVEDKYSIDRSATDKFSLDDAVMGAAIIHGQYQNAAHDYYATQDTTGCTIPLIGTASSCSSKGACCDQHDACYFMYHCDYLSWDPKGKASDACKQCNEQVKTCVNPFNGKWPGPAACCGPALKKNTCGQESPPWQASAPIPQYPSPDTKTGLDPSLSIPGSPVRHVVPDADGDEMKDTGSENASACSDDGSECTAQADPETGTEGDGSDANSQPAADDGSNTPAHDDPSTASDDQTAASDDQTAASDDQTAASDDQTAASDDQTAASEDQTAASDDQTAASDDQTAASDDQTAASDDQTAASDDQTAASDDQTAAGDDPGPDCGQDC